jgi:hypothetical protein
MKKWWWVLVLVTGCSKGALEETPTAKPIYGTDGTMPAADAGPPSTDAAAVGAIVASDAGDAAPPPSTCANGAAEIEPNDSMMTASKLVIGRNCGVIDPDDVDYFEVALEDLGAIHLDGEDEGIQLAVQSMDGQSAFVRVTGRSQQSYAIILE